MTEEKKVSFALSTSEKLFYDAGKLDGHIGAREELSRYIKSVCDVTDGEKTKEDILKSLGKIAVELSAQAEKEKTKLKTCIEMAIDRSRVVDRMARSLKLAFDGAKLGWTGKGGN